MGLQHRLLLQQQLQPLLPLPLQTSNAATTAAAATYGSSNSRMVGLHVQAVITCFC
jgi:hypothetical protein